MSIVDGYGNQVRVWWLDRCLVLVCSGDEKSANRPSSRGSE